MSASTKLLEFESNIDKSYHPKGCHIWKGSRGRGDYGVFYGLGGGGKAHRVLYILANGPIPKGLHILHSCDNPPCVNEEHLSAGTAKQNYDEMVERGRRHYPKGSLHPGSTINEAIALEIYEHPMDPSLIKTENLSRIAAIYGVSPNVVGKIKAKLRWKHIHGTHDKPKSVVINS